MGECSPQNAVFFARQTRVHLLSGYIELKMSITNTRTRGPAGVFISLGSRLQNLKRQTKHAKF